ncbi:unnamed protein product, partial [Laminaria digitata]
GGIGKGCSNISPAPTTPIICKQQQLTGEEQGVQGQGRKPCIWLEHSKLVTALLLCGFGSREQRTRPKQCPSRSLGVKLLSHSHTRPHSNPSRQRHQHPPSRSTADNPTRPLNKKMSRRQRQTSSTASLFLLLAAAASSGSSGVAAFAFLPGRLPKGLTAGGGTGTGTSSTLQLSRHFGGRLLESGQSGSRGNVVDGRSISAFGVADINSFSRSSSRSSSSSSSRRRRSGSSSRSKSSR